MGVAKEQMLREQAQQLEAEQIAVEANVLKRCPFHDVVYDPLNGDNTPAYKLGNYKYSRGELTSGYSSTREMTDAIKAAIENAAMECRDCTKE